MEHPYPAHAQWFSEIITPVIIAAAAKLRAEQRSAAETRGRDGSLWDAAATLVEHHARGIEPAEI